MADVDIVTVRDLIAALTALPEDQKDLPIEYSATVTITHDITRLAIGPADFGQQIIIS